MVKRKIHTDLRRLKEYMDEVGLKTVGLARLSNLQPVHLSKSLCGTPDNRNGRPATLSRDGLHQLEFGLELLSDALQDIFIIYETDSEICKQGGKRYCPACVEQIKQKLKPYIGVLPFMQYALGWNYGKVRNVMDFKNSASYGNITRYDCDRINITLVEIAAHLNMFTII